MRIADIEIDVYDLREKPGGARVCLPHGEWRPILATRAFKAVEARFASSPQFPTTVLTRTLLPATEGSSSASNEGFFLTLRTPRQENDAPDVIEIRGLPPVHRAPQRPPGEATGP
jgi:hypothetical protein